jgi:formate-dependent nitrite reductase membrane component NrfD
MTEHQAELRAEGRLDPSVQPRSGIAAAGRRLRGGRRRRDEHQMVPDAVFTSYYGRPVVKASPWEADIPAYLFLGGLAAGSSLLGTGAGLTGRPVLRRAGRISALGAISVSFAALVHDLGRPARFVNMLRVAKPTSPMSVGTWILTAYGPLAGAAGAAELLVPMVDRLPASARPPVRLLGRLAGPAGVGAALVAPAVASYTAALLANTSTPTWSASRKQLPFVFVGSASAASGGLGMLLAPVTEAGPARRLALGGALLELGAERAMEASMGVTAEPLHSGTGGALMRASKTLTALGAVGSLLARRSRLAAAVSGAALLAGSACTRFGIFEAGQASARDPKYTVLPQRQRIERGETAGA